MKEFKIKIADLVFEIHSEYKDTYEMCSNYLTEEKTDYIINIFPNDIDFETEKNKKECLLENRKITNYSNGYLETLAIYRKIADILPDKDTVLIHGAALGIDNNGVLFTAKSGVGKTTHIKLWLKNIPNCQIINGDKPLVSVKDKAIVYGTPWSGKENYNTNSSAELNAIVFLERAEQNSIEKISALEAFPKLLSQTYRPANNIKIKKTVDILSRLTKTVDFYKLYCNMEDEASVIAYKKIFQNFNK